MSLANEAVMERTSLRERQSRRVMFNQHSGNRIASLLFETDKDGNRNPMPLAWALIAFAIAITCLTITGMLSDVEASGALVVVLVVSILLFRSAQADKSQ